jgi:hypothetical protein
LPHKLPDYYVRFHFAHTLVKYYKTHVLSDTKLAKWEKPLDAIVSKMKRLPKPSGGEGALTSDLGTTDAFRFKKRKFTTPETLGPSIQAPNNRSDVRSYDNKRFKTDHDDTPLTDGQRRFLDRNIAKGGGIVVSEKVQNKSAWIMEARQRKLCIRCAGSGHFQNECQATSESASDRGSVTPGGGGSVTTSSSALNGPQS